MPPDGPSAPPPGRPAAWDAIGAQRDDLLRSARRWCASEADAEDCVHEAMLRAATYPGLDPERAGALLHHIARHVALNGHRARRRRHRALARLGVEASVTAAPEEPVLDRDEARWLAAHVSGLPHRERTVFAHRASGRSVAETAAILGVSYKSAESAFSRARRRLLAVAASVPAIVAALLRRLRHALPVSLATVAMTTAAIALLRPPLPFDAAGQAGSAEPASRTLPAAAGTTAQPRGSSGGAASGVTAAAAAGRQPPGHAGSQPDVVARVPVGDPAVIGARQPVTVTRADGGQTVVQSLEQCLRNGPGLQLSHFGCAPSSH